MNKVMFIGAGPGDPELLTLKGKRCLEEADLVIQADSLVNPALLDFAGENARIVGSASLNLSEIIKLIEDGVKKGLKVVRLHSGDPSVYGAIQEQMAELDSLGIQYEIVPGVTSLFAAAAALQTELTPAEVSQSVIITRMAGRTPVPPQEALHLMASHQCSMGIYLSSALAEKVSAELIKGGYAPQTPVAVVYRASWPDQKIVRTSLENLASAMQEENLNRQALIIVGKCLGSKADMPKSRLYAQEFKHGYR
ncbi:MAG: precorrin-4 C(11)-methyltransferase [Dehalococcoides mccartyi]|uniref:precorrin-4 C(11)-methyltransferase n=1 Tax=Dehalococcoides mccartyi TaxID=61435 RepID=UPI0030F4F1B3